MNTRSWCPASLRLLALLALFLPPAANASFLAGDPTYLGYRIPEHRWANWTASLDAGGSHAFNDGFFGAEQHRGAVNGHVGTRSTWGYDSDPLYHRWGFGVDLSGGRNGETVDQLLPPLSSHQENSSRGVSERFALDGAIRSYPWSVPLGFTGSTSHALDLSQNFNSLDREERNPPFERRSTSSTGQGRRDYRGTLGAGIGWGRVRDATPVFQAQVLESRLRTTGALTRELSDAARTKLAALFAVQNDVGFAHDRPDKYFWREIERILSEDGALGLRSLDPFDVFRVLEPLTIARGVTRRAGWFVGPMVSVSTLRQRATFENSSSQVILLADTVWSTNADADKGSQEIRQDDVFTSLSAEFYRPLGPRWQLDAGSFVSITEAGDFLTFSNSVAASWIVSDRWLAILRASHSGFAPGHRDARHIESWNAGLSGELDYFLEDSWALRLSANEGQLKNGAYFERTGGFSLGVTYVVSGLFEAPGLVPAMRPTPPTR